MIPVKKSLATMLLAAAFYASPADAAFINIDDSDPLNITITAGDFEDGFSVNGSLLTIGLGDSASITLPDGEHTISGSWIDDGLSGDVGLFFALPSDPAFATSGIQFTSTTDGLFGTLGGSVYGFIDSTQYFPTALATLDQNGQTGFDGTAFLSVSFVSEAAAVPEPAALLLLGTGLLLAVRRRRR